MDITEKVKGIIVEINEIDLSEEPAAKIFSLDDGIIKNQPFPFIDLY